MSPDTIIEPGGGALASYYAWFDAASVGKVVQYHLGDLAYDRNPDHHTGMTAERRRDVDALHSLAQRVLADAREGFVKLYQRKHALSIYEYLAVKIRSR